MTKCGVIDVDPLTNKPKVKLYKDAEGRNKGDGRCCYLKVRFARVGKGNVKNVSGRVGRLGAANTG